MVNETTKYLMNLSKHQSQNMTLNDFGKFDRCQKQNKKMKHDKSQSATIRTLPDGTLIPNSSNLNQYIKGMFTLLS